LTKVAKAGSSTIEKVVKILGPREKPRAMAGLVNQISSPGSESGSKTDFSRVKLQTFPSPKRSLNTSPKNG
jgi:hypothetical protein